METEMNWWQRFKTWLGWPKPEVPEVGTRREQLEAWITGHDDDLAMSHALQENHLVEHGRHLQIHAVEKHLSDIPSWATFETHVYEAPDPSDSSNPKATKHGYTMLFSVTETDGSRWLLTLDQDGQMTGWIKIQSEVNA
jgi:hypothetical protein